MDLLVFFAIGYTTLRVYPEEVPDAGIEVGK
jgi:hypothetical protein